MGAPAFCGSRISLCASCLFLGAEPGPYRPGVKQDPQSWVPCFSVRSQTHGLCHCAKGTI